MSAGLPRGEELCLRLETPEGARELKISGAVFDCDGLLVDSESIWLQMLAGWLEEASEEYDSDAALRPEDFLGLSVDDTAARLVRAEGGEPSDSAGSSCQGRVREVAAQLTERYSALLAEGVEPMPGAVELISELAARVPVAVASNGLRRDVTAMLDQVGILGTVRTVCTLDDVLHGKPEPELYLTAVGRLSIPPERAVAFEDSPAGAESARRAGLTVVGVNQSDQVQLPLTHRLKDLRQVSISTAV